MKKQHVNISLFLFLIFFLGACLGERSLKNETSAENTANIDDTITAEQESMCFLRLEGTDNQDSTYVYLHFNGDSVSGEHRWVPDMKDARNGTINGTKRGDTIDVVWSFMQEGINDTLHTVFLLKDDFLKQQPYSIQEDGRQVWDRNAAFEITYDRIDCPTIK